MLRPLQERFKRADFPRVMVGLEAGDDAAVYQIAPDQAIILTVDYFTPIVDDPYDYGAIAAANAMSDVYAMGGEVLLALNVCCFPPDLPLEVVSEILRGGADKVAEAGGAIAGGHTVDDKEPKYGLAVMGQVHPDHLLTKAGAQPGDLLFLTKRLGVGVVTTAAKRDAADPADLSQAVVEMKKLQAPAARLAVEFAAHACTDVTGFSLLGHACEIAEKSSVRLRFFFGKLPFLQGAVRYAEERRFPGGSCRNRDHYRAHVTFSAEIEEERQLLLFTPETSGGLLIALPRAQADVFLQRCEQIGQGCWQIGEVLPGGGVEVLP